MLLKPSIAAALALALAPPATAPAQQAATRVYQLPAGSRPHDVAPAPDGRIR